MIHSRLNYYFSWDRLQKVMQPNKSAASATSCKTNMQRGGECRRVPGNPADAFESVSCLSSSHRPCGYWLLLFLLTSHFTPFSKPVLVRGGQQYRRMSRLVSVPFRSAGLLSIRGGVAVARQMVNFVSVREHDSISRLLPCISLTPLSNIVSPFLALTSSQTISLIFSNIVSLLLRLPVVTVATRKRAAHRN